MPIDFSRIFSFNYIFGLTLPPFAQNTAKFFYLFLGVCLVLALSSRFIVHQQEKDKNVPLRKLWQKLTTFFASLSIAGLLLLFFRQQQIYFLSMPLFLYLWLIGALVWLIFIIRWVMTKMKRTQREIEEKKERERYL